MPAPQSLVDRVFDLLPTLRAAAAEAWDQRPYFGRWRAASDNFVHYDAALRVAAVLARELPDAAVLPYQVRSADGSARTAGVRVDYPGSELVVRVRGRLLCGYVDLEVQRG